MEATQAREQELQERIAELVAQEEAQKQELVKLAGRVELEAREVWDAQQANSYRQNATKAAVKAKRDTHVQRLRAEAELTALKISELDDQLPARRAKVERLLEQRKRLDAQMAEAQRPVHDLEGRRRDLEREYWQLTHEADAFEEGSRTL